MAQNLLKLADEFRENISTTEPSKNIIPENTKKEEKTATDDVEELELSGVYISDATAKESKDTISDDLLAANDTDGFNLTEEDLRAEMPEVSEEYFKEVSKPKLKEMMMHRKRLIIEFGLTPEQADEATRNKMKKDAFQLQKEWLEEHPKLGIVEVKKEYSDKLEFSEEEKQKLQKSRVIRLREIEDKDLKSISIKTADRELKTRYINEAKTSLAQDSVPLTGVYDYVTFQGVQVLHLYAACLFEDDTIAEGTAKKAAVLYEAFVSGLHYRKKDDAGKVIMSHDQFINSYPYFDMNIGLFSVLCASSPENTQSQFRCSKCNNTITKKYNFRNLLSYGGLDDKHKSYIDDIIKNRMNEDYLKSHVSPLYEGRRYVSEFSGNIYDLKIPSIAKALSILQYIDGNDETAFRLFQTVVFIDTIYLKTDDEEFIQYDATEPDLFWVMCNRLIQEDLDVISQLRDKYGMVCEPTFELDIDCENEKCLHHMHNRFEIDNLLFRRAQDSPEKIEVLEN